MKAKYPEIVEVLTRRIRAGDYALNALPGERKLAQELGVSHMTARRAVKQLITQGLFDRPHGGRLKQSDSKAASKNSRPLNLAWVFPAVESEVFVKWREVLRAAVTPLGGTVRPVAYAHANDSVITDALDGDFSGIVFAPPPVLPGVIEKRLSDSRHRIITFFSDLTHLGIPCVDGGRPEFLRILVEHLAGLGHREIDILNTQPMDKLIGERIASCQRAIADHGLEGRLWNRPVSLWERPDFGALRISREFFENGSFRATALITTTYPAARGVIRAAYERGIGIGPDLSLCTCDSMLDAQLNTPSLTTLIEPDPTPLVSKALEWFTRGPEHWTGPLHLTPDHVDVWVGESSAPPSRRMQATAEAR